MPDDPGFRILVETTVEARSYHAQSQIAIRDGHFRPIVGVSSASKFECAHSIRTDIRGRCSVIGAVPNIAFLAGHPMKLNTPACVRDGTTCPEIMLRLNVTSPHPVIERRWLYSHFRSLHPTSVDYGLGHRNLCSPGTSVVS